MLVELIPSADSYGVGCVAVAEDSIPPFLGLSSSFVWQQRGGCTVCRWDVTGGGNSREVKRRLVRLVLRSV